MSDQQPARGRAVWASSKTWALIMLILAAAALAIWASFTTHATTFAQGPR